MSDQSGTRRPDDTQQSPDQRPARRSGDVDARRSPLRTRRDPITGDDTVVRPPSRQPSWTDDAARRGRGTGRYAAPTSDLPPAVIPDGAPDWMGQRRRGPEQEPILPRPLGGAMRRAEDYTTDWREHAVPRTDPARSTGTWPAQPTRAPRTARPDGPDDRPLPSTGTDPSDGEPSLTDAADGAAPRASGRLRGRERPTRRPRRSGIGLLEDALSARLAIVVAVSAAVMWGLTRILIGSVDGPLTLRLGPDGAPSEIGGSGAVWQVPFVATMLALMSIGTGLLVAGRDLFAARFILGGGILVQALIWVAAITLLR